jgi:hypothetical protein
MAATLTNGDAANRSVIERSAVTAPQHSVSDSHQVELRQ